MEFKLCPIKNFKTFWFKFCYAVLNFHKYEGILKILWYITILDFAPDSSTMGQARHVYNLEQNKIQV